MHTAFLIFRYLGIYFFQGLLRWPLWWYTEGLLIVGKSLILSVRHYSQSLALWVWVKNVFVPMYGLRDWQGRFISFLVRVAQIVLRTFALFIWMLFSLFLACVYLALPIFTIFQILFHLTSFV